MTLPSGTVALLGGISGVGRAGVLSRCSPQAEHKPSLQVVTILGGRSQRVLEYVQPMVLKSEMCSRLCEILFPCGTNVIV